MSILRITGGTNVSYRNGNRNGGLIVGATGTGNLSVALGLGDYEFTGVVSRGDFVSSSTQATLSIRMDGLPVEATRLVRIDVSHDRSDFTSSVGVVGGVIGGRTGLFSNVSSVSAGSVGSGRGLILTYSSSANRDTGFGMISGDGVYNVHVFYNVASLTTINVPITAVQSGMVYGLNYGDVVSVVGGQSVTIDTTPTSIQNI